MGNDGGTIIKRLLIADLKQEDEGTVKDELTLLTSCRLSSLPLYDHPVVGDYKGRLYLKEKILEYILNKKCASKTPVDSKKESFSGDGKYDGVCHVNSMKDIIDVTITWKKVDGKQCIECPISHSIKTSNCEYVYLRTCGCVLSYKLLTKFVDHQCPQCNKPYDTVDIVRIDPLDNHQFTEANEKSYNDLVLRGLSHDKSKRKKRKSSSSSLQSTSKRSKLHT
jgi:hypothetical protein